MIIIYNPPAKEKRGENAAEVYVNTKVQHCYCLTLLALFLRASAAIAQSARRLSGSVEVGDQYHFYMEAQSSRCAPNDNGGMDVQSTTQFIDRTTQAVAGLLNIPVNR